MQISVILICGSHSIRTCAFHATQKLLYVSLCIARFIASFYSIFFLYFLHVFVTFVRHIVQCIHRALCGKYAEYFTFLLICIFYCACIRGCFRMFNNTHVFVSIGGIYVHVLIIFCVFFQFKFSE